MTSHPQIGGNFLCAVISKKIFKNSEQRGIALIEGKRILTDFNCLALLLNNRKLGLVETKKWAKLFW